MQKILKNIYLVSAAVFGIISILGFVLGKSLPAFIAGVTISLLCVAFNFMFKPSWSEEAKKSLMDSFEVLKPFGDKLPFPVLGKLQMVFIGLMFICFFKSILGIVLPTFPSWIFTVIENVASALFILGTFYAFLQGNLKTLILTTKLFAIYQIIDVILTFFTGSYTVSTKGMCLFLAFYSLSYLFEYMTKDTDPALDVEEPKEKKPKKPKKGKKDDSAEEKPSEETATEEEKTE